MAIFYVLLSVVDAINQTEDYTHTGGYNMNFLNKADQAANLEGKLLRLDLQTFADPEPTPPGDPIPPADPTPPVDPKPNDPEPPAEKSFTQEELNNIAAKEAKKAQEKILKELGIDAANAKEGLKALRELQESQKTEEQKKQERLQELETNYSNTSNENATLKAQISAMKSGVLAESVEDVVTLAKTMVNDDLDMDDAIAKVVEKYPHFAQQEKEDEPKPSFSTGKHEKQPSSEMDAWLEAFGVKKQ